MTKIQSPGEFNEKAMTSSLACMFTQDILISKIHHFKSFIFLNLFFLNWVHILIEKHGYLFTENSLFSSQQLVLNNSFKRIKMYFPIQLVCLYRELFLCILQKPRFFMRAYKFRRRDQSKNAFENNSELMQSGYGIPRW